MKVIFKRAAILETAAGKRTDNQEKLSRKELFREKLAEDPNMIKRGYKHGWIIFEERVLFVRSTWDCNICAFFQFLKVSGEIKEWEYEPETYWFKGVKRGTNNYKPDFRITLMDGSQFLIEVKAYWMAKDTVKMNRMKKYYPNLPIQIICNTKTVTDITTKYPALIWFLYANYDELVKQSAMFPGWAQTMVKRSEIQHLLDKEIRKF